MTKSILKFTLTNISQQFYLCLEDEYTTLRDQFTSIELENKKLHETLQTMQQINNSYLTKKTWKQHEEGQQICFISVQLRN